MKKLLGILFFYIILVVLLLPLAVTFLLGGFSREIPQQAKVLFGTADLTPLESELEEYVVGVVAAEMPAAFPEEALKAQAVAARTYQVRQMQAAGTDEVLYDVGQAYITTEEQQKKWGENYPFYAAKIRKAVKDTAGEIMVYEGNP
ncbi:SpoIID/LytB domain-containing protein, partial [Anaerotignum sp.]